MENQLISLLLSTGLDEQRAQIYMVLLSLGEGQAKQVATVMKMGRTAVYDNLRYLEERGYVTVVYHGKRKIFLPLHPKELYKRSQQQMKQLKDLLPDFLALYADQAQQPTVQLFRGIHAAREVYEDILAVTKHEYHYFSPPQLTYQALEKAYIKKWIDRRVHKGIHSYSLRVKQRDIKDEPWFGSDARFLRQIRYLPAYVDLHATVYIYENNIGIISGQQEQSATIIHSPDLAYSFRQIFQFLWSVSLKT